MSIHIRKKHLVFFSVYVVLSLAWMGNRVQSQSSNLIPPGATFEFLFERTAPLVGGLTEGPAVAPDGSIYFTDIPQSGGTGMILRFDPQTKNTTVFAEDSRMANGLIFDTKGRLWACEGANKGGQAIVWWDVKKKERHVVSDRFGDKRFNSPNDLCLDKKGQVYFTDPRYVGDEPIELEHRSVYRVDTGGKVEIITSDVTQPNGIAISHDGKSLYVANTDRGDETRAASMKVYVFSLDGNGKVTGPRRTLINFGKETGCDGMCLDEEGRIYLAIRETTRPGILVLSPEGRELAFLATANKTLPSNVEFGISDDRNVLYTTIGTGLFRVRLNSVGPIRKFQSRPSNGSQQP